MKKLAKDSSEKGDLILLHNTKLKTSHSAKLRFCWSGLYHIHQVIKEKGMYFLEELDGTSFRKHFHENRIKQFWVCDEPIYVSADDNENKEDQEESEIENEDLSIDVKQQQNNENEAR